MVHARQSNYAHRRPRHGRQRCSDSRGESVCLSYPSANRDPEAFAEPFQFDIGRVPNRHLGFGSGVHFCLGAALARMEVDSFFAELIPRLDSVGLAGEPEYLPTTFVGGLKRLPLNYTMR